MNEENAQTLGEKPSKKRRYRNHKDNLKKEANKATVEPQNAQNTQNAESSNKIVTNVAKIEDSNHHIFFLPFVSYQDINGNYELSLRYFDFDFMLGAKTLITPYPKTMLDISNGYKINI